MSDYLCTDNRFELIEKYKQKLIDGTNIEMAPDEMAVIDDILFRFWQMDWLDKLDADAVPVVRCKDCEVLITRTQGGKSVYYCPFISHYTCETFFCAKGRRLKDV